MFLFICCRKAGDDPKFAIFLPDTQNHAGYLLCTDDDY